MKSGNKGHTEGCRAIENAGAYAIVRGGQMDLHRTVAEVDRTSRSVPAIARHASRKCTSVSHLVEMAVLQLEANMKRWR